MIPEQRRTSSDRQDLSSACQTKTNADEAGRHSIVSAAGRPQPSGIATPNSYHSSVSARGDADANRDTDDGPCNEQEHTREEPVTAEKPISTNDHDEKQQSCGSVTSEITGHTGDENSSSSDLGKPAPLHSVGVASKDPALRKIGSSRNVSRKASRATIAPAPQDGLPNVLNEKSLAMAGIEIDSTPKLEQSTSAIQSGGGEEVVKLSLPKRLYTAFRRAYCPKHDADLILPTGPTDAEKYCYLHTNRLLLYAFGVLSFLTLSAGMWLFVVSSPIFAWFGIPTALLQIYLIVSYVVSLCGRDFDFEAHKKVLEEHPMDPETCPTVDIYLPCCKEPLEILENTYEHVQQLIYPDGKLKVYVLDDGGMDEVKQLAERFGFTYICREDRPRLKKAGNLRWAFARTQGDFFNIYDADFCPRPDFLMEVIPQHLADPKTAIIQTPQFFRVSSNQTWTEQGASAVQELFYRVVQVNRDRWGASICVGSNAVYRRAALEEVGGTAEIGFSEDVHTGFGAVDRGWKVKYLPLNLACGICPDNPRAFFSQQMRWCMGSTTLLSNKEFWKSSLTFKQKACYLCGMMYYTAMALSIFISPLPGVLLIWFRPQYFVYYNLAFAIPSILYGLCCLRVWAKASYGINVQYIMLIQSYAYLNAVKDRVLGKGLAWAPSGDNKSHKNNKYRNMRILCIMWSLAITGALASGMTYQILRGLKWWNCLPLAFLHLFNMLCAHRFMFYCG
ncbi:Hypothetical protein D9617_10g071910 [Elsinoe fawcettii]|nr:Hypothetical protein D9617_10g071910 [Elsinoe fawcettii]